jgi:hypothetical protein
MAFRFRQVLKYFYFQNHRMDFFYDLEKDCLNNELILKKGQNTDFRKFCSKMKKKLPNKIFCFSLCTNLKLNGSIKLKNNITSPQFNWSSLLLFFLCIYVLFVQLASSCKSMSPWSFCFCIFFLYLFHTKCKKKSNSYNSAQISFF